MKAVIFRGAGQLELADMPAPEPAAGEVRVRVHYCGICGSDIEAYHTGIYTPGVVIGHEFAGTVDAVGAGIRDWEPGDRVTADSIIPCGRCWFCQHRRPTLCQEFRTVGIGLNGGMAEYVCLPTEVLHRLPDNVTTRQGALFEPLSIALHCVRLSEFEPGSRVVLLGAGPIGLLTLQCLLADEPRQVIVVEGIPRRAELAIELGAASVYSPQQPDLGMELRAEMDGLGPDVVFICTGAAPAFQEAFNIVRKGGQVFAVGLCLEPVPVNFFSLVLGEIDVRGGFLGWDVSAGALDYLARGIARVEPLITHEVGIEEAVDEGFGLVLNADSDAVKVLVRT